MTDRIKKLLEFLNAKEYYKQRKHVDSPKDFWRRSLDEIMTYFYTCIEHESPIAFEDDNFGFNHSVDVKFVAGAGNITPNYKLVMSRGFDDIIREINDSIAKTDDENKKAFGKAMLQMLDTCLEYCEKQKKQAKESGNEKLYNALLKIPRKPADSFYEACLFIKISIYFLRYTSAGHLGLGRFDQYMYEYYKKDIEKGVTKDELFETLEEFFISINYDTDRYFGIQQGDNGQSMVLGGYDKDGNCDYNELSEMCMNASLELCLIDPKINLRVNAKTPDEIYEFATRLTKNGLGFPQYCNDDVVIPGLIKLGYDPEDAYNYVVAACWEFIIPNCNGDCPNRELFNFPLVINQAIHAHLNESETFEILMGHVKKAVEKECDRLMYLCKDDHLSTVYNPLVSVFTDGCTKTLENTWSGGAKYNNYGCHGTGIANATDALSAVKKLIFDEKTYSKEELLAALNADFEGCDAIRAAMRACPKMGDNDDYADDIAAQLMDAFSYINNKPNCIGGIWRAGTGSAHGYLYAAEKCPATADGRKSSDAYSSSFSPSLDIKPNGLLSVIQSFTKYDMTNIINGGPLTIEIHDSVLRNDIGIKKTAQLVKNFILLGGHQLQLNSINREKLIDAKAHPEKYPNLIVRVWGWSGYFNELDTSYQDHIIRRCEFVN